MSKNQKILVEIYDKTGLKQRKKCKIIGNQVEIRPKKTRDPGWYADFGELSIVYFMSGFPFKKLNRKLMVKEGATRCISLRSFPVEVPVWDSRMEKEVANAHILKHAGTSLQKVQVPSWLIMILLANIGLTVIILLKILGVRM